MYKGYKKASTFIVIFLLISTLFCFSASAETQTTNFSDFWTPGAGFYYYILSTDNSWVDITDKFITTFTTDGSVMTVQMFPDETWGAGNFIRMNTTFVLKERYVSQGYSSLKFNVGQWNSGKVSFLGDTSNKNYNQTNSFRFGDGLSPEQQKANLTLSDPWAKFSFDDYYFNKGFTRVNVSLCFYMNEKISSGERVYFEFSGLEYIYYTDNEYQSQRIINNQNDNTDKIIANQDENTQAIIDNEKELYEQEKQEITDSGNQATDAAENIPDKSAGFIDALGTFVDTMSTTSTDCKFTFPQIKIPAVPGLWSENILSEENVVDISSAVKLIPSSIMKLIQAITTIALVVFCFKELYDTISEALTRKKASSDG